MGIDPVTATIGASVLGAGAQIIGGSQAAGAQEAAANNASAIQLAMFNKVQQNLQPYMDTGKNALTKAEALAGNFNFKPTQAEISQTPGYEFNLNQGLKSVQNAAAARGLGNSGAALKGAANFATGLADSTYQNQFNNALTSYQTNYGGLSNLAGLGENAAAGVGNAGVQTGASIGSNIIGAGNAAAASYMNAANGIGNAAQSVPSSMFANQLLGMYGGQNSSASSSNWAPWQQPGYVNP